MRSPSAGRVAWDLCRQGSLIITGGAAHHGRRRSLSTEGGQVMKQQMEAELLFDCPDARDRAIVELTKRGFDVEILDWVDEYEGVLLTPTVWIKVRGASEDTEDEFFAEMHELAKQFS